MARGADHRTGRAALRTREHARLGFDHRGVAALASRDGVTRDAREQTRATLPVEHAHRAVARVDRRVERARQRVAQQSVAGRLVAQVHDLTAGQPARSSTGVGRVGAPSVNTRASGLGTGATSVTDAPVAPRALDGHVACVPGGHPLLLERLVALVEHDHRGEIRHRHPDRDPTPDDDHRPGACGSPGPGPRRVVVVGPQHQHPMSADAPDRAPTRRGDGRREPGRRSNPRQRHAPPPAPADPRPAATPPPRAPTGPGAPTAESATGPGPRWAATPTGTARPRSPPTGARPSARARTRAGRSRTHDLGDRQDPARGGVRLAVGRRHPAAHPAAVQRDPHDACRRARPAVIDSGTE